MLGCRWLWEGSGVSPPGRKSSRVVRTESGTVTLRVSGVTRKRTRMACHLGVLLNKVGKGYCGEKV